MESQPQEAGAVSSAAQPVAATPQASAEAARERAAQFMSERKFAEARKALEEADALEANTDRSAQVEAARAQAAQFMTERKFTEAKKALEEAESLESPSRARRAISSLRSRLRPAKSSEGTAQTSPSEAAEPVSEPVEKSLGIVSLYSKIAAAAGLLPGGLLNFGAILAVQVIMVWKIAKAFGHNEGKERIRGSILSLFGSALPTGIGHGAGIAIAAIPAVIAGTAVYFLVTPVLAYAMTRAVGSVFIMHFESGGTLLTFDPKAFGEYFVSEFKKAGGSVKTEPPATVEPATV